MANALNTAGQWVLDTASATAVIEALPVFIQTIRWDAEAAAAGDNATLTDAKGGIIWTSTASGANYAEEVFKSKWYDGLRLTVLGAGKVYVDLG